MVFSRKILRVLFFFRYCAPDASAPVVVVNESPNFAEICKEIVVLRQERVREFSGKVAEIPRTFSDTCLQRPFPNDTISALLINSNKEYYGCDHLSVARCPLESEKVFASQERVSGFPEKGADLRGSPGNFRGSLGNFRGSLGNFRGPLDCC